MAEFWEKIESDLHLKIPSFIKNGFELSGYANALVFRKVTDDDINMVESFIKDEMMTLVLQHTANTLNESDEHSFVEREDILFDDEQRIKYFGKLYAKQPEKFRFQPGDRILIKELVTFVGRVVDEKGLHTFKQKKTMEKAAKKNMKKNSKPKHQSKTSTPHPSSTEINIEELKSNLIHRLKVCLYSHRANHVFDLDLENDIHEDNVQVTMCNGDVNGAIRCIICDSENKPKNEPKHVHYSSGSDWPCWVLSNFTTHLRKKHGLKFHKIDTDLADKNGVLPEQNLDESVVCLNSSPQSASKSPKEVEAISSKFYTQLSGQIALMMTVVLKNSELEEQIYFKLTDSAQQLTIATIAKDGNCLFSALTHQLENHRLNGKAHKTATDKLRYDVCEYILENNANFAHQLKDRVYELKPREDIDNIDTECKLFVSLYLKQNGKHGGAETIHAVSQMKKVNIVVFNEDGPCHMPANINEKYNRTVCIAYQRARNAKGEALNERNHYGSVCDINSAILYDAARANANKQK